MKTINTFIHKYFWTICFFALGLFAFLFFVLFNNVWLLFISGFHCGFATFATMEASRLTKDD